MIEWLSGWYNWPFLFPLALGLLYIVLDTVLGGLSELLGLDGDMDFDGDGDIDGAGDLDHGGALSGLLWLGMGKVPLSIILEVLFISFGCIGLLVNALWSEVSPDITLWLSLPAALVLASLGSMTLTHFSASTLARWLPDDSTITRKAGGWKSEVGTVISKVTALAGQIRIEGSGTTPAVVLNVKKHPSAPDDIPQGTQVVVLEYLEASNCYLVTPLESIK